MLEHYKKEFFQSVNQYLVVDLDGTIKESDDKILSNLVDKNIAEIHPFFESLNDALKLKNKDYVFYCIHLTDQKGKTIITDIVLKTFDGKQLPLVVILDLTLHYRNYQTSAQIRNESIINSQILELKNEYLLEKEDFKNTFITNFSHELRDPITGILTFSNILKKTNLSPEQSNYLKVIHNSTNHLKNLIEDILDISKIETGIVQLILEPFSLKNLLQDIEAVFQGKAKQKGLEFKVNIDDRLPEIVGGDALRLRQVLSNLLENAIKFTDQGTVSFSASLNQINAGKANVHFSIQDTGIGIPEDQIETVFRSFHQLNTKSTINGTGLGLAIAQYFVALSNSKIKVVSKVNEGSTFSTNISFKVNHHYKLNKIKKEGSTSRPKSDRKYNILLVEDSEITQLSVLKILAVRGNYFLDIVSDTEDVLPTIENSEFDLILMDIKLSNDSGEDIAQKIRKMDEREHRRIPIIALTAKVFKEDLRRYKKSGINDVIKKPFDEDTLLDKIGEYLK